MAEDESEFLKLPVDERCIHKAWKARISGYEEAKKLFVQWDEDDEKWRKYLGIIKKMVTDSNAVAQEKGLDCVMLFAENCKMANKTASEVAEGLVLKCVAAPKTKTKDMATQIFLMYVEIETHEKVIEALIAGLAQKNPKIVYGCVFNMTEILAAFGAKYIKVSPLIKAAIPLLDHRDKDVREQAKKLVIESYKWIGPMMKNQLTGVKPIQLTEFEAEFEKLAGSGQPKATRWLRSVGPPRQVDRGGGGTAEGDGENEGEEEEGGDEVDEALDPYEMMDPVEILSKLPKNFFEQIEEKKWQLRKESLDAVLPLSQNPKLQPGDYHELVKALKKVVAKDTNVMLVALSTQILTGLAKGLRNSFKNQANNLLSTLLEKFKEKKLNVVTALRECCDAIYPILGIEAVQEDCLAALKHKTPQVKSETASFLARGFATCPQVLQTNKKVLKGYVSALQDTLNESDPGVREASAEALGALTKFLGEGKVFPLMPDIDNLKQEKIKEKADKIELSGKGAKPAAAPKKEPAAKPSGPRVVKPDAKAAAAESKPAAASKPTSGPPKKVVKSGGAKKGGPGGAAKSGGSGGTDSSQSIGLEPDITLEEAEERCEEVFSTDILSGLGDSNWKNRLASMETVVSTLDSAPDKIKTGLIVLKLLSTKKPGLKENNFQVLGLKLKAISLVAKKSSITQQGWDSLYPEIVDKFSDKKNLENTKNTLYDIADSSHFPTIFSAVLEGAFNQKNPAVKVEALNWAAEGLKLFSLAGAQPKIALDMIKKGLSETNPGVRTASIGLLGVLHWFVGAMARRMFEDEKPQVLSQIDAEIEKYAGQPTPAPTRGPKSRGGGGGGSTAGVEEDGEGGDDGGDSGAVIEDLVPRNNIAAQLTPELLDMIKDKNWKIRKEGLDKLKEIVNTAKFITNDLGGLPSALGPRTTDMNKILATQALELVGELAIAMGPQTRVQVPQLLPCVLAALADSKNTVRAAARATLNTMVKETSLKDMFVNEIVSTAVAKGNPFVKQEIWTWLSEVLSEGKGLPKEELVACLTPLYAGVEDRSADVRKPAQDCVLPIMKHIGFEAMRRATEKLSPVSKNTITPLLEKARGELPVVAAPPPKSAGKPAGGGAPSKAKPVREPSSDAIKNNGSKPASAAGGKTVAKSKLGLTKTNATKKAAEDLDTSPLYQANKLKSQRFKDESKLKILKWNFSTPRAEFVDQLKEQMTVANFNRSLFTMMFHSDFKQHLKALDQLLEFSASDVDALMANLDIILKWITLRFFETNPSVNLKGLEYLIQVFTLLSEAEDGYVLHELEASAFIPYLVNKMGDPKDQIRNYCRTIMRLICGLYTPIKLFPYLMTGLANKNAKLRTECLEELGNHIRNSGLEVCGSQPASSLKEIAKQIADRDTSVRNAALNAVTEAYFKAGEKLYKMIGNIPEKDMAMLEERIKRSAKNRPKEPEPQAPPQDSGRKPSSHSKIGLARPGAPGQARQGPPGAAGSAGHGGRSGSVASNGSDPSDLRQRYQRSPPEGGRAGGGAATRPVSGVFSLDLAKIEGDKERLSGGPKLIEHNLEDIMNSEPIALPVTRTGLQRMMSPEHMNHSRNGHTSTVQEDRQAVTTVIAQIINPDTQSCIRALAEIDVLLKDNTKSDLFGPCIDHLVSMCSMQYKYVLDTKLRDPTSNENESLRNLQYLTMVLMTLYGNRELVRKASTQVLHDLMNIIVLLLNDPVVVNLSQGAQLIRAWNVLTVKIVDKSNHNSVTVALIKLLHECVGSTQLPEKYCTHIMKCLWKVIRGLPTWLPHMEPGPVLVALHQFLETFPASYSKTMADDTPIRTIKTVIHTLVQELGEDILQSIDRIPNPDTSELVAYIRKLLANGVAKAKKGTSAAAAPVADEGSAKKKSARFSNSDHEALADIFKKIGQKELSKIGLKELYKFKQDNPHADLEPFLAKSSTYFRDYIDRGLKNVEEELARGGSTTVHQQQSSTQQYTMNTQARTGSVLQDNNTQPTHLVFLERLKKLRAAGGLDTGDQENRDSNMQEHSSYTSQESRYKEYSSSTGIQAYRENMTTASSGYSSGAHSAYTRHTSAYGSGADRNQNLTAQLENGGSGSSEAAGQPRPQQPDVEDLKERLARIKNQAAY